MHKKIIGLVSPFKEPNFGTVLQAYALQHVLESRGLTTEYIQYTTDSRNALFRILSNLKSKVISLKINLRKTQSSLDNYLFFETKEFATLIKGFKRFSSERIKKSPLVYNPDSIMKCKRYRGYIVGSDQTWSQQRFNKNTINFLGQISDNFLRFSYAPSFGTTHIPESYLEKIVPLLERFDLISCRERTNCNRLRVALKRDVHFVLDPTLLLSTIEWNKISSPTKLETNRYVLCYILGEKDSTIEFAEFLGKEENLPVFYIVTRPKYLRMKNRLYPTPEQFITLIRDAAYVITDSFHATIFSINFNTQFCSFTKRSATDRCDDNDRMLEVLTEFNLRDRLLTDGFMSLLPKIDFTEANIILKNSRGASSEFIEKIIGKIVE